MRNARIAAIAAFVLFVTLAGITPLDGQSNLVEVAKAQQQYAVSLRREFHQNFNGTRWSERETKALARIHQEIAALYKASGSKAGFDVGEGKGGLWVDLTFNPKFDRVLFRAEIDGLPVTEATGLAYASATPGTMHACGHDANTAMLLAAFGAIVEGKVTPRHNLRFVFQRAEENPVSKNGGQTLVEDDNVLQGISEVYALHIWVGTPGNSGGFLSRPGPIFANNDQFFITVKAPGGHVAMPHSGSNAIEVGRAIMDALEGFDRRSPLLGPMAPASIVPAAFQAGDLLQANVRPAEAKLTYACRTFLDQEGRKKLAAALEQKVRDAAKAFPDAKVDFAFSYGYPATINAPENVNRLSGLLKTAGFKYEELQSLGGEDFSYYLQKRPGANFLLGAWQEGTGGHHSPTFNPDESVFWQGVQFWLILATN